MRFGFLQFSASMQLPALALLGFCVFSHICQADVLGGAVEITPLPGWMQTDPRPGKPSPPLPTLRYVPKDGRSATLLITLIPAKLARVSDLTSLETFFGFLTRQYLPTPETPVTPIELKMPHGLAMYASFIDPKLVGKPPKKDDFKVSTPVAAFIGGDATLQITIFTDSTDTSDFTEALKIIQSASLRSGPLTRAANAATTSGPTVAKIGDRKTIVVPSLGAVFGLPARFEPGLKLNSHPGYFIFVDEKHVNLSGWLVPAREFNGMKDFWTKEKATMTGEAGMSVEGDTFKIINGWTAVLYTVRLGSMPPQKNIRACRVVGDTWADVHLSILRADSSWKELEDVVYALTLAAK